MVLIFVFVMGLVSFVCSWLLLDLSLCIFLIIVICWFGCLIGVLLRMVRVVCMDVGFVL